MLSLVYGRERDVRRDWRGDPNILGGTPRGPQDTKGSVVEHNVDKWTNRFISESRNVGSKSELKVWGLGPWYGSCVHKSLILSDRREFEF